MTPEEQEMYQKMADLVAGNSNNYRNYDSTLEFDSLMNMDDGESVLNMDYGMRPLAMSQVNQKGLSTYNFTIFYTDNSGTGDPVNVTLFRSYFNEGTFVGDDLVFTNSAGDTATVRGRTSGFRQFQRRAETQSVRVAYTRQKPVDEAQFDQEITFLKSSVLGGNKDNNIVPETFITPEQFQLLRVDIPMNFDIDGDRGWSLDVLATEVQASGGTRYTLFINKLMDPARMMKGKSPVVDLTGQGIMQDSASVSLQGQIEALQRLRLGK